jgi:hypothetical protein
MSGEQSYSLGDREVAESQVLCTSVCQLNSSVALKRRRSPGTLKTRKWQGNMYLYQLTSHIHLRTRSRQGDRYYTSLGARLAVAQLWRQRQGDRYDV